MFLLNIHTLQLEDFSTRRVPRYCILSHRWGREEVSFKEMRKGTVTSGSGYSKIVGFCEFVKSFPVHWDSSSEKVWQEKIDWVWIDTCK